MSAHLLPSAPQSGIRRARPALGTLVSIHAYEASCASTVNKSFELLRSLTQTFNSREPTSEISQLMHCRPNTVVHLSPPLASVLSFAAELQTVSEGAFRFTAYSNFEEVLIFESPSEVRLLSAATLDLDGIAKGYIVDQLTASLASATSGKIKISAGGEVKVLRGTETIAIRAPSPDGAVLPLTLVLENNAIASSGNYLASDRKTGSLFNYGKNRTFPTNVSISVRAPSCMVADAMTKVIAFAPRSLGTALLQKFNADAFIITDDNRTATVEHLH